MNEEMGFGKIKPVNILLMTLLLQHSLSVRLSVLNCVT